MQVALMLMVSQFFFSPIPVDWQMNQQNVVIRGTVVDGATGHAVPGVTVFARSGAFDASTTSDSKGEFIFLTLFPGTYYLGALKRDRDAGVYGTPGSPFNEAPELFAGYEYGATVVLQP
jgi:hypothetical protein